MAESVPGGRIEKEREKDDARERDRCRSRTHTTTIANGEMVNDRRTTFDGILQH